MRIIDAILKLTITMHGTTASKQNYTTKYDHQVAITELKELGVEDRIEDGHCRRCRLWIM
jgi:hypothetical protein